MRWSVRTVGAAAVVLTLLGPATAHSAPRRPACHLITDPQGDTEVLTPDNQQRLDIVSADVAANSRQLTAVIRLPALTGEDPTELAGRIYEFDFTAGPASFMLGAYLMYGGAHFEAYLTDQPVQNAQASAQSGTAIGRITGVIDTRRKEIRMSAPLSLFTQNGAKLGNAPIDHLGAMTFWARGTGSMASAGPVDSYGGPAVGSSVDIATSDKSIYVGFPSCVTIGR